MMMTTADHVKMESPFYHEEALSLQDFSHFSAAYSGHLGSGPGAPRAGRYPEQKLMVGHPHGHLKKKSGAALPPPSPGHFPEVITRSAGALKLLPTASGGGLGGSPPGGGRGGVASTVITVAGISVGPAAGGPSSPSDAALLAAGPQPSLNLLKLSSPELEHLIIQANPDLAPTAPAGSPPHALPAQPFLYRSQGITQEQEGFADGFVKALADLHKQNQLLGAPPLSPSAAASLQGAPYPRSLHPAGEAPVYTNLSSFSPTAQLSPPPGPFPVFPTLQGLPVRHHPRLEEPQTVPEGGTPPGPPLSVGVDPCAGVSPPSLSPMDPETQERIKAERKRLRNRIAASKCRKRKLERIARLEEKVKVLKSQNSDLASTASLLREQVSQLKQKVHSHVSSGCQIPAKASPPLGKAEATGR